MLTGPSRILAFAAALYLLAILGAMIAPGPRQVEPVATELPTPKNHAIQSLQQQQVVGFSLNVHHTEQLPKYLRAIDMISEMGSNSLQILTPAFQDDGTSTQIHITNAPGRCPSRRQLLTLLRYAKNHGLKTLLMPTILLSHPRGNEWRGKISPENWDAWWTGYTTVMRHFAQLAQEADVDVLSVGSELLSTERQTPRWTALIRQLRLDFGGQLLYATNWDHYNVPTFWDQVDYVGISGYWRLSDVIIDSPNAVIDPKPILAEITPRWKSVQNNLHAFAKQVGRPILLTELGYPSLPWALKDPWNYVNDGTTPAVPAIQAIGYRSFCDNWSSLIHPGGAITPTGFAGVLFYTWNPYNGGMRDPGYGVWGKPAQDIVRQWLRESQTEP